MLHTLLVGIEQYPKINNLRMVREDLELMQELVSQTKVGGQKIVLLDQQATKVNILSNFERLLTNAKGEDICLFYFSGHGSQLSQPPRELRHLLIGREKGNFETLVAYDSRSSVAGDIVDKEIADIIGRKMACNDLSGIGHIVVILDSCHSGDASRDGLKDGNLYRTIPAIAQMDIQQFYGYRIGHNYPQRGSHIQIAACSAEEKAIDGAFTRILTDNLKKYGKNRTYAQIINSIRNDMKSLHHPAPKPIVFSEPARWSSLPFLGGTLK
jgi:uncharacterized caspase-like protein